MPLRYFVAGTDTGVGKTEVAAALLALLADQGRRPAAFKPYESGCKDVRSPADASTLRQAAGNVDPLGQVCLHAFRAPLAPAIAAAQEGRPPSWSQTLQAFRAFRGRELVVEAAGGLLVPLDERHDVLDLIAALRLPVVLVARAGLGTLNHTGLSLWALKARKVPIACVVLSQSACGRDPSVVDNGRWIARRHGVRVLGPVPFVRGAQKRRAAFRKVLSSLVESGVRPRKSS